MMKRLTLTLPLLTLLLAALGLSSLVQPTPVSAQAETVQTKEELPFDTTFTDTCAGEPIQLTGTIYVTTTVTVDSRQSCFPIEGGEHVRISERFVGTAIGLSTGTEYQIRGAEHDLIQRLGNETAGGSQCDTFPLIFSNAGTLNLVSPGGDQNLLVHITLHTTFDSRGRVTSDTGNAFVECRGRK